MGGHYHLQCSAPKLYFKGSTSRVYFLTGCEFQNSFLLNFSTKFTYSKFTALIRRSDYPDTREACVGLRTSFNRTITPPSSCEFGPGLDGPRLCVFVTQLTPGAPASKSGPHSSSWLEAGSRAGSDRGWAPPSHRDVCCCCLPWAEEEAEEGVSGLL